jgi:hypothetical protein
MPNDKRIWIVNEEKYSDRESSNMHEHSDKEKFPQLVDTTSHKRLEQSGVEKISLDWLSIVSRGRDLVKYNRWKVMVLNAVTHLCYTELFSKHPSRCWEYRGVTNHRFHRNYFPWIISTKYKFSKWVSLHQNSESAIPKSLMEHNPNCFFP